MSARIGLVDYGMGNRRSAEKALVRVGATVSRTDDHAALRAADGLVVPGVGAFPEAMRRLAQAGLDELLRERARAGVPILGICLGMQLLFEGSTEKEGAVGLGLLPGTVDALPAPARKLPHIGWTPVGMRRESRLVAGLPEGCAFYHVHSFAPKPAEPDDVVGTAEYGEPFASIVAREDAGLYGVQFHPEKSSRHGLALLANFVGICSAGAGVRDGAGAAAAAS